MSHSESHYTPTDLKLLIDKGTRYPCEGYFIMGDPVKRSWVGKITGRSPITDFKLLRIPINGGLRLEPTSYGELPRGMAIWFLSPGLYQFSLHSDAFSDAEEYFGEVDEVGGFHRLSREEVLSRMSL